MSSQANNNITVVLPEGAPRNNESVASKEAAAMRVLLVHNRYQQAGGEDQVFEGEAALLSRHGHDVAAFELNNDSIQEMSRFAVAAKTVWNQASYRNIRTVMQKFRPDVVHFHNTFPFVSAAAYYAAKRERVAVVQTLHNYRLLCPCAVLYRAGEICELCIGKPLAWPAIRFGCYRNNRSATATVTAMLSTHKLLRTWTSKVDLYIALTNFARDKFVQGGFPAAKLAVKPNFVDPDPGMGSGNGGFALFAGRLTQEKGLKALLDAWKIVGTRFPLKIAGGGPLQELVARSAVETPGVEFLGQLPRQQILTLMQRAALLIVPSAWYEGCPMTIVEAFACGLPVMASDLGSMASLIEDGKNGIKFSPGNAEELASKAIWAASCEGHLTRMRAIARCSFESNHTAEANYRQLIAIYQRARTANGAIVSDFPDTARQGAARRVGDCGR